MLQFTDQSTDPDGAADIVSWSWDLGDGMTSTTQNHTHTYNTAATFTVRLIVTDSQGQTGTAIKSVTVSMGGQPPPPPARGSSLKSFDTNNNNIIDDAEFFAIIDAWIAGQIDDATFFQAVASISMS
jgi:PKD repeat protein